jgi:hypothetical protein
MIKTRSELKTAIDALLVDNQNNSITPGQINSLLTDIIDSVFTQEDDYSYPVTVETINITSPSIGVKVEGTRVLTVQQPGIATISETTGTLADCISAINSVIDAITEHGLIESI